MNLAVSCYQATAAFPAAEAFGLTSQIRLAAGSIAANIAEGHGRETTCSFVQFLRVAQGSLKELETHLILSARVGVLPAQRNEELLAKCAEIGKMFRALIRSLQSKK